MSQKARESLEPNGTTSFFSERMDGHFCPRNVLVDSEPLVIDTIMRGPGGRLYENDQFVAG